MGTSTWQFAKYLALVNSSTWQFAKYRITYLQTDKMSSKDVRPSLRGKVLKKPAIKNWFPNIELEKESEYAYTFSDDTVWTPFNSNLHMQGIKVLVKEPVPETSKKADAIEDTLFLLEMVKEERRKEKEEEKAQQIKKKKKKKKKRLERRSASRH